MIKTVVVPALLAVGLVVCVMAQSEADYAGWMKDVGSTKGKVGKAIAAKQTDDVATGATHLADIFKQVGAFWAGRNVADAVTFAKTAETAATDLAAAAKAADDAKMQSSMQAINGTCAGCHMAHRDGSPGSFKIK